jgi:hypothetical protein
LVLCQYCVKNRVFDDGVVGITSRFFFAEVVYEWSHSSSPLVALMARTGKTLTFYLYVFIYLLIYSFIYGLFNDAVTK